MRKLYQEGHVDVLPEWGLLVGAPKGRGLIVGSIEEPYRKNDFLWAAPMKTAKHPGRARQFYCSYLLTDERAVYQQDGYNIEERA